MDIGQVD
jgi:hypothetical protein